MFFLLILAQISVFTPSETLSSFASLESSFLQVTEAAKADVLLIERENPLSSLQVPVVIFAPAAEATQTTPVSIQYVGVKDHPFALIDWNSAPQVLVWTKLSLLPKETVWVETESGDPFLVSGPSGVRWGLYLQKENRQFLSWPALPYLVYASVVLAKKEEPVLFADWEASPLPGAHTPWIIGITGFLVFLSLFLFILAKKIPSKTAETEFCETIRSLQAKKDNWQNISFSRPLAGFLFFLATQLCFLLFLGYLTEVVSPNWIQPFPLADGMYAWITTTFAVVWYLFDAGTRDAFIKLFSETRLIDPSRALRYAQFFVWWQLLTGILQIVLITILVLGPLSESSYSLYAWPLLLHSAAQWPGIQGVFQAYFIAMQRFDYAQILDLLVGTFLGLLVPIGAVLLFRSWGANHPSYGEAMGAIFGLAVTSYIVQLGTLGFGALLAKRAKFPIRALFAASFTRKTAKDMLSYGIRMTLGQLPNRLSFAVNNYILKTRLLNYGELSGIYGRLDSNFLKYFKWSYSFYASGVPTFSEAFGGKKHILVQYYLARFWQYGALFSAIIFAFILSTGTPFVQFALDTQWARISDYILLASLIGLLLGPSWLSDALQQGAGRPGLFGILVASEQLARIVLLLYLIGPLQFQGFLLAIAIPLLVKTLIAWTINHRLIVKIPFYAWSHLFGPFLIGSILYLIFSVFAFWVNSALSASILFFGGGVFAILLGFFLAGVFGVFDKIAYQEMDNAVSMTGPFSRILKPLSLAVHFGRRVSPFGDKFAIPLAEEAAKEAKELEERAKSQ